MVLYTNININQRVEVWWKNKIYTGVVKYKGCINGKAGDWVGVDLDKAVGEHDGMLNARRYFFGRFNHCIFTSANYIRFIPMKRNSYHKYKHVPTDDTGFEEALFTKHVPDYSDTNTGRIGIDPAVLNDYNKRNMEFDYLRMSSMFGLPPKVGKLLPHAIGSHVPQPKPNLTMQHSKSTLPVYPSKLAHEKTTGYNLAQSYEELQRPRPRSPIKDFPLRVQYDDDGNDWITSASIPQPHMPAAIQEKEVKRGWRSGHYPRHIIVPNGRDIIKLRQWNDISP